MHALFFYYNDHFFSLFNTQYVALAVIIVGVLISLLLIVTILAAVKRYNLGKVYNVILYITVKCTIMIMHITFHYFLS